MDTKDWFELGSILVGFVLTIGMLKAGQSNLVQNFKDLSERFTNVQDTVTTLQISSGKITTWAENHEIRDNERHREISLKLDDLNGAIKQHGRQIHSIELKQAHAQGDGD